MATRNAIRAIPEAICNLLEQSWQPMPDVLQPRFEIYRRADFEMPMATGVSVFVQRVSVDSTQRLPERHAGRNSSGPLCVSVLLTAWASSASTEHSLLGWLMETLDDNPILSPELLNARTPDTFASGETVELVHEHPTSDELHQFWQAMAFPLHLSLGYQARGIRL